LALPRLDDIPVFAVKNRTIFEPQNDVHVKKFLQEQTGIMRNPEVKKIQFMKKELTPRGGGSFGIFDSDLFLAARQFSLSEVPNAQFWLRSCMLK
jgi:hypothetical protein